MIYDKDFLKELDSYPNKITYARITSLNLYEQPIETIEGKITSGNINIDGSSAVRRTCSLSIIAQDININEYYWGLKTKFKLEIGLKNDINLNYPDIIWFPQGIYVITNFGTNLSTSNYVINISGKDKMCLLNGESGGILNSTIDFGTQEIIDQNGVIHLVKIPIKDIIREAVHQYGGEYFHNIIINDLEDLGLELLEYRYNTSMFLYREYESDEYIDATFNEEQECYLGKEEDSKKIFFKDIEIYDPLISSLLNNIPNPTKIYFAGKDNSANSRIGPYAVAKIDYGQTGGYRFTDLIYPDDLISNIGDNLTSILDKIVNMLGNFEYFYDLEGRFVFQKKKNYINTSFSLLNKNENEVSYVEGMAYTTEYGYVFNNNNLINSFSNSPNLSNLKNDYSIWGTKISLNNTEIPILMRYAIDEKPFYYRTLTVTEEELKDYNNIYNTNLKSQNSITFVTKNDYIYDKEKIYVYLNDSTTITVGAIEQLITWGIVSGEEFININPNNVNCTIEGVSEGSAIIAAYLEDGTLIQTYSIIVMEKIVEVDWREIIYQMALDYNKFNHLDNFELKIIEANKKNDLYNTGRTGYEQYYIDMLGFWRELYNPEYFININGMEKNEIENNDTPSGILAYNINADELGDFYLGLDGEKIGKENFYSPEEDINKKYWSKQVYNKPENLNFWIDFLDNAGELSKYSNKTIGNRALAVKDNNVNAIYYKNTPNIIFTTLDQLNNIKNENRSGYKYFLTSNIDNMFSISAQGKSAKDTVDELLYNHSYCIDIININIVPIYYLNPNTRIYLYDKKTNIEGDYIIDKISMSFGTGQLMTVTAYKTAERLL